MAEKETKSRRKVGEGFPAWQSKHGSVSVADMFKNKAPQQVTEAIAKVEADKAKAKQAKVDKKGKRK